VLPAHHLVTHGVVVGMSEESKEIDQQFLDAQRKRKTT
jgi:hypothetical protein